MHILQFNSIWQYGTFVCSPSNMQFKLSYRHAVRGTRKGQWEKRPAYPKASKVVGKTPSIPKASKAVGKNAQHTPRRARQWEKRPAYPRRARQWEKRPAYPKASKVVRKNVQHTQGEQGSGKNTQHTQGKQGLTFRGLNLIIPTKPTLSLQWGEDPPKPPS